MTTELEFRPDFAAVSENWRRFWAGTLGRPILLAEPPLPGVEPVAKPPWGAAYTRDGEAVVDQLLRWAQTHQFLGDSVPYGYPSLIIDLLPAFLGAEIVEVREAWGTDTHARPCLEDLGSTEIRFRPESPWWERWVRLAECFTRKCAGRLICGTAAPYYNNLDTLAALRGNTRLLTDLYDDPEGVHRAMRQIMAAYAEVTAEACRLLQVDRYGSTTGHGFYVAGRAVTVQCDFGFNISPEHFREFALPYLREEVGLHDAVEYHLDGPGNIRHLEAVCSLERVAVVQWVPGAGDAPGQDWSRLYARISALGKGLWLSAQTPEAAVALWERYGAAGRMVLNVQAADQAAMDRYLQAFERHGRTRSARAAGCHGYGELAALSGAEFADRYLPRRVASRCVRAADLLSGRTHSEAIEAALAMAEGSGAAAAVVLDARDWLLDRAIRLPSNLELVIDGCCVKLAAGVFDNIIRTAGICPDPADPWGRCRAVTPTENLRITGRNGAVLEGADVPYTAANPKTGVIEPWLGDFFGWRTVGIQLSCVTRYELSGFTMRRTHCWAISQEQCRYGYLHDLAFDTAVKNGDGIDFRNGCAFCLVENITGTTSDDTVACTALTGGYLTPESKYVYPMQPLGPGAEGAAADIHDVAIRNIRTGGRHHGVICLATSPRVYNITIEDVIEDRPSTRESCVRIYTGYGSGYAPGNLSRISVRNVVSTGAQYAAIVKAAVRDVELSGLAQLNPDGELTLVEGESEGLVIAPAPAADGGV